MYKDCSYPTSCPTVPIRARSRGPVSCSRSIRCLALEAFSKTSWICREVLSLEHLGAQALLSAGESQIGQERSPRFTAGCPRVARLTYDLRPGGNTTLLLSTNVVSCETTKIRTFPAA